MGTFKELWNQKSYEYSALKIKESINDWNSEQRRKIALVKWVWELIQNACDKLEDKKDISINIEYDDERLVFKHNGGHFKNEEILALISAGSTKPFDQINKEDEKTGKFGKGFLVSHVVSPKVKIEGQLEKKPFRIYIDRSGDKEEISKNISECIDKLDKNEMLESTSSEWTTYTYEEINRDSYEGINRLKKLIPFIFSFRPEISSIKINDEEFSIKERKCESYEEKTLEFIYLNNDDTILTFKNDKDNTTISVLLNDKDKKIRVLENNVPKIFKKEPLIGTSGFTFPIIINGNFETDSDRLNLSRPTDDKQKIVGALELIYPLWNYLKDKYTNCYYLFKFSKVEEDTNRDFWNIVVKELVEDWINKPIIKIDDDPKKPKEIFLPRIQCQWVARIS